MKEINLDNLAGSDLVDHAALAEAFKKYLMDILNYSEVEANFVVEADFKNPYDAQFIMQDYEGEFLVDGKEYEVRSCYTDFRTCGLPHLEEFPSFEFYVFFDRETILDDTILSYRNATKMYLVE